MKIAKAQQNIDQRRQLLLSLSSLSHFLSRRGKEPSLERKLKLRKKKKRRGSIALINLNTSDPKRFDPSAIIGSVSSVFRYQSQKRGEKIGRLLVTYSEFPLSV